ncbi:MAG TPA: ArsB/NhaD family transporter, partial [Flavisolibacter sp.]|nr:ArsB/NhaD family transporter [Flavisolibacter sp.]
MDLPLGLPTAIAGIIITVIVLIVTRQRPFKVIRGVSWSVLPLVAGLFMIVEALNKTGLTEQLSNLLRIHGEGSVHQTAWGSGISIALISNLVNNLPSGLIAGSALQITHVPEIVRSAMLIGVDLGPNLSVTGSLATILWLVALRREQQDISAWTFLKIGCLVMTIPLLCALAALFV